MPLKNGHIIAVTACVRGPDDYVLLVRSPRRGWELPGGRMKRGETLVEALHREVEEESGVLIEIERLGGVYQNLSDSILIFEFVGRAVGGDLRTSETSIEVDWFPAEDAGQIISHPAMRLRFDDLISTASGIPYCAYQTAPFVPLFAERF